MGGKVEQWSGGHGKWSKPTDCIWLTKLRPSQNFVRQKEDHTCSTYANQLASS